MPKPPTVKAVIHYAAQLRTAGDREAARDCYASPYRPSEAAARKLSTRLGPAAAIDHLRKRAAMHDHQARENTETAQASLTRLTQRHLRDQRDRQARARGLTPGARIDQALASLAVISAAPATQMSSDTVHGGDKARTPKWHGDTYSQARARALACADQLERMLEECQRRDLTRAA